MSTGILCVSHSKKIAEGLQDLLAQISSDVSKTFSGGLEDGSIGTSFDDISKALEANPAERIFAFFDLGSARMNLEMAQEMSDKDITVFDVPLIEGAYAAAALLQAGAKEEDILKQLDELKITK